MKPTFGGNLQVKVCTDDETMHAVYVTHALTITRMTMRRTRCSI